MRNKTLMMMGARRAFTLIELILVVTIMGILMAVVVPRIGGVNEKMKIKAEQQSIKNMATCMSTFEVHTGRYPTTEEGLQALITKPSDLDDEEWEGPYMKDMTDLPKDQWKQDYIYRCPGESGAEFDLISKGPDKQENTADDISNIRKRK